MKKIAGRLFIFLMLSVASISSAQISPGKLSRRHVALEGISNCTSCHELGQSASPIKCLQCHVMLKSRIEAGLGFHASAEVRGKLCFKCHSEHHGLDYQLVKWPDKRENFNHELTGFKLESAHAKQECTACHKAPFNRAASGDQSLNIERTLLGLDRKCLSCHADEHQGQLGAECLKCHSMDGWKPVTGFKHETAKFALTGKHASVECQKCHKYQTAPASQFAGILTKKQDAGQYSVYKNLNFSSCTACHQDAHKGKFGADCEKCHSTTGFNQIKGAAFDHSKTDYPLLGKHLDVACAKCHRSDSKTAQLKFAVCKDCHSDEHRGQFKDRPDGGACESCHSVEGFLPAKFGIEEHQKSRFVLTGGHLATPCIACHAAVKDSSGATYAQFDHSDFKCKTCHSDIHKGEVDRLMAGSGCESCHSTEAWGKVTFDHAKTRFALEGKHQTARCDGCHRILEGGKKVVKLAGLSAYCGDCHKDSHRGQLALAEEKGKAQCSRCHTPAGWRWLKFEHNRDSQFKLEGVHAKVACEKCHFSETAPDGGTMIRFKPVGMTCTDCHGGNDAGKGK